MKEITHLGLAKIVGNLRFEEIDSNELQILIDSSIEPDQINKELIAKDIVKSLVIPIDWLINHTIRAKRLAIRCLTETHSRFKKNDKSWIRFMGWTFHYITDWGTPHHSPISKSNPVLGFTGGGALIGGFIGGISNADKKLNEILISIMKGALVGAGIGGTVGLIGLVIEHSHFEKICDTRWNYSKQKVNEKFLQTRQNYSMDLSLVDRLIVFENKMDSLRKKCNSLPANWIDVSSEDEFIEYMLEIAHIMDFALQLVIR